MKIKKKNMAQKLIQKLVQNSRKKIMFPRVSCFSFPTCMQGFRPQKHQNRTKDKKHRIKQ